MIFFQGLYPLLLLKYAEMIYKLRITSSESPA
jgi:hypothetical protein